MNVSQNSFIGDAAGFFLLTALYARSTSQSTTFSDIDGFDSNSGWTDSVEDDTFTCNGSAHTSHLTRNSASLTFNRRELAAMRYVSPLTTVPHTLTQNY